MTIKSNFPEIRPSLNLDFANTRALDPRITFTRTTTATYYDGKTTAKAEENLLPYSQEFDNGAWSKTAITVTANNDTAPDGTSTAELVAETATTSFHGLAGGTNLRFNAVSGQSYVFSIFLKKGSGATAPDIMQLSWGVGGFASDVYANFNLDTGVVSDSGAGATATITSAGNGWYRCSFVATANATAASTTSLFFCNNNGTATRAPSYLGVVTSDVLAWGAQVEQRSAVSSYTPTTTQPITNYIPVLQTAASGVARFDHNPTTGESLGLLVEEQRTNLVTYSAEFDNAAWTKTRSSITANTIVAPDGALTGDKLVENTDSSTTHYVRASVSLTASTLYTFSIYAKAAERSEIVIRTFSGGGWSNASSILVDLSDGTATVTGTGATGSATSVGNGWYRVTFSQTTNATTGTKTIDTFTATGGTDLYTGDGYSGIYIWGAQLEAAAFPTSYIATVAATVTRNADAASMTGANFSSWYAQPGGTTFVEAIPYASSASVPNDRGIVAYSVNAFGTGHAIRQLTTDVSALSRFGSGSVASTSGSAATAGQAFKAAAVLLPTERVISFNGAATLTNSVVLTDFSPIQMLIANQDFTGSSPRNWNGTIKKLAYYPAVLADAQLQALTS